jgi:bifunctional UDP-N-acetylglucosamine pyrophosphorylase/glucosamine-1-phosphate N-acetyltransferase
VIAAARALKPAGIAVVGGAGLPALRRALQDERLAFARQPEPHGTADAVRKALRHLPRSGADVVILCGDAPLVRGSSLRRALGQHRRRKAELTVLTAELADPTGLGRILRNGQGELLRVVEERDATAEERALTEVNAGQYVVRVETLRRLLPRIGRDNAQGEYYLTDLVGLVAGRKTACTLEDPDEARGINRPAEFRAVQRIFGERILEAIEAAGATLVAPSLTYVECGVTVGLGAVIHPFSVVRAGVSIGALCEVGPYAHLRQGTVLEPGSRIGGFVEVKASRLGPRSRALHLAYLGDAEIGADVNVGAGTVTANYDGQRKHRTVVEDGVFLGSGTLLVAPVTVRKGARTGAGAVIPAGHDVRAGTTVVGVPARELPDRGRSGGGRAAKRGRSGGPARRRRSRG